MSASPIRCLTLMLSNRCPLQCVHCGPTSGPRESGDLSFEQITQSIDDACRIGCDGINISGGEPFVVYDLLSRVVEYSAAKKVWTRVTTGAYWAATAQRSLDRLQPLAEAGLSQVCVSTSSSHAQEVPVSHVLNAVEAAQRLSIAAAVTVAVSRDGTVTPQTVRAAFHEAGIPAPVILVSSIVPFGRAAMSQRYNQPPAPRELPELVGQCESMMRHPTILSDGRVAGCGSVFSRECEPLIFGSVFDSTLTAVIARIEQAPLSNMIHRLGLGAMKELIEANSELRFDGPYVNMCHLCGDMLQNATAVKTLRDLGMIA